MITIKNFSKSYKKNHVFENVNLTIIKNGYYYFMGKNGSGKTTFFNCLLGFERFEGDISINTKNVAAVFDTEQLYTHLSIEDNILIFLKKNLNDDQKRFFHSYVSIDRKKKVKTLSLGQRKIVAILIAVLRNSQLLVLDEISNGLDIDNASKIKTLLCECKKKMIILSCGHQLDFHSDILDNALIINKKTITFVGENHNLEDVYESIISSSKERTLLSI